MIIQSFEALQEAVERGETSYEAITANYIERINRYNNKVNAVACINPLAIEQARFLDLELKEKGKRSPIHGMPILLKDNIHVVDGDMPTTAGAYVFRDMKVPYNATIVEKLMAAGAIILGKANMTEFANFISETSPNGYSALKGQVLNPYGPFDVGGSSSGSGVAVACGFCQVAIGTETSGSIISPSASNSVIGLKPTVGRISRYGIIPISHTQDIPGPMGLFIEDVTQVLKVLEGYDQHDVTTLGFVKNEALMAMDGHEEMKPKKLGIFIPVEERSAINLERLEVFKKKMDFLQSHDIELVTLNIGSDIDREDIDVLFYEFAEDMADYLKTVAGVTQMTSLKDIVSFNETNPEKYIPYEQAIFMRSLEYDRKKSTAYEAALSKSMDYGRIMEEWLDQYDLEAVCYVHCDGVDMAARKGMPSITIPIGYTKEGAPVGLTMTGIKGSEDRLLKMGAYMMKNLGEHKPPKGILEHE